MRTLLRLFESRCYPLLLGLFVVCIQAVGSNCGHAGIWSGFQGNAGHTGYVAGSGAPTQVTPTWTVETVAFYDPTPATQFTPGIASDGVNVFVSWRGWPSTMNGVSALNIATGQEAWEWTFAGNDTEAISAPAYENGKLYVHRWGHSSSCGTTCNDKPRLLGIDASNGQQLFDQSHSGQWSSGGRPTAYGGQVFVAGGYYGGLDNYDGGNGNIAWFARMPQTYGWIPAADGDSIYTSFNGHLTMVDTATGNSVQTLLAPSGGGYGSSTPTVAGPHEAYVPFGSLITQFDPANKYATWEYKNPSGKGANQGIAVGDNALYVNFSDTLTALDRQTGDMLWKWTAPIALTSNVILTDSHFYVGNNSETLAINRLSRVVDWSAPYGGTLSMVNSYLFISNSDAVHAFAVTVPEPSSALLLMPAFILLAWRRRR